MKYCLSSRQTGEYLKKCDEIKVMWNDRNIIFDLVEKYPGKLIDLRRMYHHNDTIDWQEVQQLVKLTQGNILIGLSLMPEMQKAQELKLPWYYLEPARTFDELNSLTRMGAAAAFIAPPIFFQMDKIKTYNLKIKVVANATPYFLDREDGVAGSWIRPEDVEMYEDYIDSLEFQTNTLSQEQALYRIYAEQHTWPGDLGLIISDLNHLGVNRMIPSTMTENRLNCGQRCQDPRGHCRICYRLLDMADPELIKNYVEATQTQI